MPKESKFEQELRANLGTLFPGSFFLKMYPFVQGFPDRLLLYRNTWVALEVKKSRFAPHEPNQDYYVELLNAMSLARFIYPENEAEVLNEIQRTFGDARSSRFSKP